MVADLIREFLLETPPNVGSGIKEIFKTIKFGNRLRKALHRRSTDCYGYFY